MLRPSPRAVLRPQIPQYILARRATAPARRYISFAPPASRPRSFKNFAARCAIAAAGVWWFTNTDIFADEGYARKRVAEIYDEDEEEQQLPTVEQVAEARKQRQAALSASAVPVAADGIADADAAVELEEEAEQQGAFNEETGEINWDCPCLGGMAHGPCGPEFREAFSCFVYSKEEPKGVDCIDRFKGMQDCFRLHPDIYGAELADDEAEGEDEEGGQTQVQMREQETPSSALAARSPEAPTPADTQETNSSRAAAAALPATTTTSTTRSFAPDQTEVAQSSSPPSVSHPTAVAVREKPEEVRENLKKETKRKTSS